MQLRPGTNRPACVFRTAVGIALCLLPLAARAGETACRIPDLAHEVRCGEVAARSEAVAIAYVRVPARARLASTDAVYFVAGGPGQSATSLAGTMTGVLARLNNRRDLVFVDVRGTGRSAPLDCPGEEALTMAERLDEAAMRAHVRRCAERHRSRPLALYGTPGAVADIEAVRGALGHDRINVVAASYGTRVALAYRALHPDRVRAMVLDGVLPPDHSLAAHSAHHLSVAWDALLQACAEDEACAALEPAAALRVLLDAPPVQMVLRNPLTGATERVGSSPRMALALLRATLHSPVAQSALPAVLHLSRDGRMEPLLALASSVWNARRAEGFARGAHMATICNEDAVAPGPAPPPAGRAGLFDGVTAEGYRTQCDDWRRPGALPLPPLKTATTPVLLLSGGLDPVTPPALAQRVADALGPQARHLVSPGGGHGLLAAGCTRDLVYRFVDDGMTGLDAPPGVACLTQTPRPAFLPPPGAAP